jgi:hypothetical protein
MALIDIHASTTTRTSEHQRAVRPASRRPLGRHLPIDQLRFALQARPRLRRFKFEWPGDFFSLPRTARRSRLCDVLRRVSYHSARRARRRQASRAPVCRCCARALGACQGWLSSCAGSLFDRAAFVQRYRRAQPVREGRQAVGVLRRGGKASTTTTATAYRCCRHMILPPKNLFSDGDSDRHSCAEGRRQRVRLSATGEGHTSGAT